MPNTEQAQPKDERLQFSLPVLFQQAATHVTLYLASSEITEVQAGNKVSTALPFAGHVC